jgi:hypothetical protein
MPCLNIAPGVHVCQTTGTTAPVAGRRRKRFWCFACRRHGLHTLMMFDPGPESYYGPHVWWECPQCHEEHVLFPGREWVDES